MVPDKASLLAQFEPDSELLNLVVEHKEAFVGVFNVRFNVMKPRVPCRYHGRLTHDPAVYDDCGDSDKYRTDDVCLRLRMSMQWLRTAA